MCAFVALQSISGSLAVPAAAGVGFAVIAVCYRIGQARNVTAPPIAGILSAFAMLYCLWGAWHELPVAPRLVWVWGIASGLSQYATVRLLTVALRLGPLSPLWCAVALGFVPQTVYALLRFGEPVDTMQVFGLGCGIACVVLASRRGTPSSPGSGQVKHSADGSDKLLYAAVLLGILIVNSLPAMGLKDLSRACGPDGRPWSQCFGNTFLLLMYACLGLPVLVESLVVRRQSWPWRRALPLGALAGAGSVFGMTMMALASELQAAAAFPVMGMVSILLVAVVSVMAFRERADSLWFGVIGLGLASVVLANWQQVAQLLR